jgi:hypothetical protein
MNPGLIQIADDGAVDYTTTEEVNNNESPRSNSFSSEADV